MSWTKEKQRLNHKRWRRENVEKWRITRNRATAKCRSTPEYLARRRKIDAIRRKKNALIIGKRHNAWRRLQYKNNIEFRLKDLLRGRMKRMVGKLKKSSSAVKILGCSLVELKTHIESQFHPGMTWENHSFNGWHIDHKIPCASFDLNDAEQQKECFHYTNLQPLWAKDNLSKGSKCPV